MRECKSTQIKYQQHVYTQYLIKEGIRFPNNKNKKTTAIIISVKEISYWFGFGAI